MGGPTTESEYGRLRGVAVSNEVDAYLGIPYATPPVGDHRWKPTLAPRPWSGVRDASSFGPDPIQPPGMRTLRGPRMAEDCLYLNVWAPKQRRVGGWPVLIWSCGGAFTMGSGSFAEEDPAQLAAKGAVVVSFNIRLNVFGFFAHPALSEESPHFSSGNYGLLDQAEAFAFIRRNIAAFGGDAEKLTFFGQSAGATVGALLLHSPLTDRPYDRAILQSPGSFSALLPLAEAERHGAPLADSVEQLRAIPEAELPVRARALAAAVPSLWLARPFRPIADGWVVTSETPFASGQFVPVPAIIGTNADEGRFFAPRMGIETRKDYEAFVSRIFGRRLDAALERYPVGKDEDVSAMFSAVYGDRGFTQPIDVLARAFAGGGVDVYRYVYAYRHDAQAPLPTHSDEADRLFGNGAQRNTRDMQMTDILTRYWLGFADGGVPAADGLPIWPRYSVDHDDYLELASPPVAKANWRSEYVDFVSENKAD